MAVREILLNALLDHNNLSLLLEVVLKETSVDLIFRYEPEGDLLDYLSSAKHLGKRMNEQKARVLFQQIVDALTWLHERGLVHGDIKPDNILIDTNGRVTIIDFGFTLLTLPLTSATPKSDRYRGSLYYAAPEILAQKPYHGHSTDIWSLGITLYVLTTGELPFDARNVSDMFTSMVHQRLTFPRHISPALKSLLLSMLDPDPEKRATLSGIKDSVWFTQSPLSDPVNSNVQDGMEKVMTYIIEKNWFTKLELEEARNTRKPGPTYATLQLILHQYNKVSLLDGMNNSFLSLTHLEGLLHEEETKSENQERHEIISHEMNSILEESEGE